MIWRKGISQTFSADGALMADERWQILRFVNGAVQLDGEVTRLAPFMEPRMESLGLTLTGQIARSGLTSVVVQESRGRREGRVNVVDGRAYFCWRQGQETSRTERTWPDEAEVIYTSALFATALVWRSSLALGQARAFGCAWLDVVSFQPSFGDGVLTRLEDEERATRFGVMRLRHYALTQTSRDPSCQTEWWCDADGIVFDAMASDGTRTTLTAVNFR